MSNLKPSQIAEIIDLHINQGKSYSWIIKNKGYSNYSIAKYTKLYRENVSPQIKVYSINLFVVWSLVILIVLLVFTGLYTFLNYVI